MTTFDASLVALVLAVLAWEVRQEAGRSLLDAFMTFVALVLAREYTEPVAAWLRWAPAPDGSPSPMAAALCFAGFWLLGLFISRAVHQQTSWSMDHFDPAIGCAFGMAVAVMLGHVYTDVAARQALARRGDLPPALQASAMADEFRSFRTYHKMMTVFHNAQQGE